MSSASDRPASLRVYREHWSSLAECRSADPELFFPLYDFGTSAMQIADAKTFCARCLVRRQCLAFAVRTGQAHGVWGGMTEQERYAAGLITRLHVRPALQTRARPS
jgi:WhiB family transcriptional regulator, redox-sensing transcriptional regulator